MAEEKKPLTKSQFLAAVAEEAGTTKTEVTLMWNALQTVILKQIGKNRRGPGQITLPGLLKIVKLVNQVQRGLFAVFGLTLAEGVSVFVEF